MRKKTGMTQSEVAKCADVSEVSMDGMNERDYFVKRLRIAVADSMLKQCTVAERAGITEASMSRYVNGIRTPSVVILSRLCSVLHCDANWLLGVKNE